MTFPAQRSRDAAYGVVWTVGVLGVALSVATAVWFWREARQLDQVRFDQITHKLTAYLDLHTEKIEAMLRDLQRVLSASPEPSLSDWEEFMNQVTPTWNYPGVIAIGYATNHDTARVLESMGPWLRAESPRKGWDFFNAPPNGLFEARRWSLWITDVYRDGIEPVSGFKQQERSLSRAESKFHWARFRDFADDVAFQESCPFELRTVVSPQK